MKFTASILALAAIASFGALAQQAPINPATAHAAKVALIERLKAADKDGDGRISREEAAALPHLAKNFDRLDTNKDGFISRDELQAARKHRQAAMFKKIDTDGDGRISRQEAASRPMLSKHFDQIDTNKDGYLSRDELIAARQRHLQGK